MSIMHYNLCIVFNSKLISVSCYLIKQSIYFSESQNYCLTYKCMFTNCKSTNTSVDFYLEQVSNYNNLCTSHKTTNI